MFLPDKAMLEKAHPGDRQHHLPDANAIARQTTGALPVWMC
jgi:hypothetical protein